MNRAVHSQFGFTLLELMVSMSIVSALAAIAIPAYKGTMDQAKIAATASEMKSFISAFYVYYADHEEFPPDSHRTLPAGMESLIPARLWTDETPIGGFYNWEGPDHYEYAAISLFECDADQETLKILDRMLDDGILSSGKFRLGSNGRPTYILEE